MFYPCLYGTHFAPYIDRLLVVKCSFYEFENKFFTITGLVFVRSVNILPNLKCLIFRLTFITRVDLRSVIKECRIYNTSTLFGVIFGLLQCYSASSITYGIELRRYLQSWCYSLQSFD